MESEEEYKSPTEQKEETEPESIDEITVEESKPNIIEPEPTPEPNVEPIPITVPEPELTDEQRKAIEEESKKKAIEEAKIIAIGVSAQVGIVLATNAIKTLAPKMLGKRSATKIVSKVAAKAGKEGLERAGIKI